MHEHVFVLDHELMRVFPSTYPLDRGAAVDDAVRRLDELADAGIDTIVDMTVLGLGRDVGLLCAVAARTKLQIVAATGAYVLRDLPPVLQLRGPGRTAFGGVEPMVEMFIGDLTAGIEGTQVRAGVLKCASDRFGMTKDCERVARAVAQAHRETGALISTHSNARYESGTEQLRIFAQEGVSLARVVVGHCGDTADLGYLRSLLDQGASIGLDRFGLDYYLPLDQRVATVIALVELGYGAQLVLSHDACCHHIGYSADEMKAAAPRHQFTLVSSDVIPALRQAGVDDSALGEMLVGNPRRLLTPGI